jgi:serine/threonine protein kinase
MEPQDTIFLKARDIADPAERAAYLTQACGNDTVLRQRVEAMLCDATGADEFFGPEDTVINTAPVTEGPGTVIGRFKLLQKIAEGGMGVVYMAEQREPVIRKVALKIIKLGMDTKQVVARFEAERQALALMDHPNIAKVLDGGATQSGRPYFVMELVPGLPITQFCDEANLSTRDRLELFMEVCSAIQHAHQKGIIHRDIKPSNILVTLHGDKPVPKVIDFGVAKATQGRLTEKTLFTQFQQFIGTPAYMSPEQASLSGWVLTLAATSTRSVCCCMNFSRAGHRSMARNCSRPGWTKCGGRSGKSSRSGPRIGSARCRATT